MWAVFFFSACKYVRRLWIIIIIIIIIMAVMTVMMTDESYRSGCNFSRNV